LMVIREVGAHLACGLSLVLARAAQLPCRPTVLTASPSPARLPSHTTRYVSALRRPVRHPGHPVVPTASGRPQRRSNAPSWATSAQAVRASLLASATTTTLTGRRSSI